MKKISTFMMMGALFVGPAMADFVEPVSETKTDTVTTATVNAGGGFVGGQETIVTVKQVN